MRSAHSVSTVRAAERELMARLPEGALMRRAAGGLAAVAAGLLPRVYGSRVTLLVGSGDNGGDALLAGAALARRGAAVTALLLDPERAHSGGLVALRAAGGYAVPASATLSARDRRPALVLDGITGIGGKGELRAGAAELVAQLDAPTLAVDLPSGVDADTGEVPGAAVHADATVTFGTYKPGLLVDPARSRAGALRLVDIGLGPYLPASPELVALQHADVARLLPAPTAQSDKYRRGVVGVYAGSPQYPGAAVLAVSGALRGGAGAVRYAGHATAEVLARHPETLVWDGSPRGAGRVQSWVVGPGLGSGGPGSQAESAVREVLAMDVPVLVDADGLRLLDAEQVRARTAPTVLTPHAGEAASLLGGSREAVEAGRLDAVRALARKYEATVLLKGSTTLVADGHQPVRANPTGTAWLATAGTGDVLSGLTGALLAAGLAPLDAAATGAYLHGLAARLGPAPLTASDVAAALPAAWQQVSEEDRRRFAVG